MLNAGMSEQAAIGIAEMNEARTNGIMYEDYLKHKPELGKTKFAEFVKTFVSVFNQ